MPLSSPHREGVCSRQDPPIMGVSSDQALSRSFSIHSILNPSHQVETPNRQRKFGDLDSPPSTASSLPHNPPNSVAPTPTVGTAARYTLRPDGTPVSSLTRPPRPILPRGPAASFGARLNPPTAIIDAIETETGTLSKAGNPPLPTPPAGQILYPHRCFGPRFSHASGTVLALTPKSRYEQAMMVGHDSYQGIFDTDQSLTLIPVDVQAASKMADEKRKQNADASARSRQRRKKKEREASQTFSRLQEIAEERDFYRGERDFLRDFIARRMGQAQVPPRPSYPRLSPAAPHLSGQSKKDVDWKRHSAKQ